LFTTSAGAPAAAHAASLAARDRARRSGARTLLAGSLIVKLLYVSTAYPPSTGGAQIHHHLLARQMQRRHSVQVVSLWDENRTDWLLGTTLRAPRAHRSYEIDGVPVHRLGLSLADRFSMTPYAAVYYAAMSSSAPRIASRYLRYLRPHAADADLVHNVRMGREPLSHAALTVARERGIPFVLTPVHHPRWRGFRYRFFNRLYRAADAVVALTVAEKQVLVDLGVREERITVTGIGPVLAEQADSDGFRARHGIQGPMILFAGQHYPYKGYREVLEAARMVWERVPDAHFVFIGPSIGGSERDFARMPDRRIHRLGNVSLAEKTNAFAACDVFCMPSTQESFGGVYTEAWSFGSPVIGCPIPAVAEIVDDGVDGYLADQAAGPIAERIVTLLLDRGLREAMGAAGKEKVERRFQWDVLAALTEEAYAGALHTTASRASA
jgi:glycosyltransferase involved in cell wall biosynthesis